MITERVSPLFRHPVQYDIIFSTDNGWHGSAPKGLQRSTFILWSDMIFFLGNSLST